MAAVSIYLDIRRAKKDGTYPLKLNISVNKSVKLLVNLNIDLSESQWSSGKVVSHYDQKMINKYLHQRIVQVEHELNELEISGAINTISLNEFKSIIDNIFDRTSKRIFTVKDHCLEFIKYKDKIATIEGYKNTLIKISTFADVEKLTFKMITPLWLRDFEQHMKSQGLAVNTIFTHMRNLRSIFNDAINTDKISQELYPFRKFKIKSERTVKRSLTIEELRTIRDYPCQPHQEKYRDIFMLIFYMEGINIVDLLNLKNLNNGRVDFRRSKTGRLYSIKVEPEAQLIIDKYKGVNYVLDILNTYSDYRNFRQRMNTNLQNIGELEMIDNAAKDSKFVKKNKKYITALFPELTTYWARHSWATIAASIDIPKETIAAALGHGGNTVTDIYIDFDRSKVDEANRRVLDAIK